MADEKPDIARWVDEGAKAIGLPIAPQYRANVILNVERSLAMTGGEIGFLLGSLELNQRRTHILLGGSGAVLLLVSHLIDDRAGRADTRRNSV